MSGFPFDPTYGYSREALLRVGVPDEPDGFGEFWRGRYEDARRVETRPEVGALEEVRDGVRIHEVTFTSVGGVRLGGWLVRPAEGPVRRGFVIGHGYGGRDAPGPAVPLPLPGSAAILPCVRGMETRGRAPGTGTGTGTGIPADAPSHVLHGIRSRETYVLGDCVADLWCAASALRELLPESPAAPLAYLGESLGGGLGALALPWDDRFVCAALTVPTFGNHPLRLTLPCVGSGESVRAYHATHPEVTEVLPYFDAAAAATRIRVPVLVAAADADPSVPPPGQYAVHNGLREDLRTLHPLSAGHMEYAGEERERAQLAAALTEFAGAYM
ncbi:acetylxylan esterase [Streptomyces sp. NPDC048172]|uniref:acetylxylan esterase n=1 Tax=Streptomyces sp. NPDC048172 TaxID=3365505 RepID=UPI0037144150